MNKILTAMGHGTAYFLSLSILFIVTKFLLKNKRWSWMSGFLLLSITTNAVVCNIIKRILGRARPTLLFHHDIYGFTLLKSQVAYLSFPSGHSMLITSFMLGLCFLFTRYWIAFVLLFLVISLSRIVVTAHYLSDVVAGMYLSILIVPWLVSFWNGYQNPDRKDVKVSLPAC